MIYVFFLIVYDQKSYLAKKKIIFAEINLTTRGPLYTCLVYFFIYLSKITIVQYTVSVIQNKDWGIYILLQNL